MYIYAHMYMFIYIPVGCSRKAVARSGDEGASKKKSSEQMSKKTSKETSKEKSIERKYVKSHVKYEKYINRDVKYVNREVKYVIHTCERRNPHI